MNVLIVQATNKLLEGMVNYDFARVMTLDSSSRPGFDLDGTIFSVERMIDRLKVMSGLDPALQIEEAHGSLSLVVDKRRYRVTIVFKDATKGRTAEIEIEEESP